MPNILYSILLSATAYILWLVLRPFVVRTSLANVAGPASSSWLTGNLSQFYASDGWQFHRDLVEKYGAVSKFFGLLGEEHIYVSDPLALHHIFIKDQEKYEESPATRASSHLMFGESLLSALGDKHKRQRRILNPVFSIKHMRGITSIFYSITHELCDKLTDELKSGKEELNMLDWMSRASMEYIGRGGLGYTFDALDRSKTNAYAESVKMVFPTLLELSLWREFLPFLMNWTSAKLRRKLVELAPFAIVQKAKAIVDIMDETTIKIYGEKKQAVREGKLGKDMMSVLLKANMDVDEKDRLPEVELLGQMTLLIFAGHDTTSHALALMLYALAQHPEEQERLREEVTAARKEYGDMDYDKLMALPYLDAVCRESLRICCPVIFMSRMTTEEVVMPLMNPIKSADGRTEIKEVLIPKNTNVHTNLIGANRDKAIWGEDAEEWKPERWLNPLPESVSKARLPGVYSSMMTFIGGSRACLGFKFAELEIKIVLCVLLEKFRFAPSDKEINWIMSAIVAPVVPGSSDSQLPMRVSLVSN